MGGDDCDDRDSENGNDSDGDFDADDTDDSICDIFNLRYVCKIMMIMVMRIFCQDDMFACPAQNDDEDDDDDDDDM